MSNSIVNLVTYHSSNNYGSNLQAIALSRVLTEMGCDVYILDRLSAKKFMVRHPVLLYARLWNKLERRKTKVFLNRYHIHCHKQE